MTLTEFLLARIAEDEALADRSVQVGTKGAQLISFGQPDAPPTLIMHPSRVLAECEAKRRIVRRSAWAGRHSEWADNHYWVDADANLRDLAAVYADHPDYRPEWRP